MEQVASINTTAPQLRILKAGTCPTLSGKGKGTLTYHIGCTVDSEICFRMASNSGGGYFSPEWVSLKSILEAFDKGPKPLTSFALWPLFNGKSVNTPGFIFAALKNEGLVQRDEENPRVYVSVAPKAFIAEVKKLIASDVDIKVAAKVVGKGVVKGKPKAAEVVPIVEPSKSKPKKSKPSDAESPATLL